MPDFDFPIPQIRARRLRSSPAMRRLVRETRLSAADLIYPLFVTHEANVRREIASMPGNFHWSVDRIAAECAAVSELGIPAVILFGIPESKDPSGAAAWDDEAPVQRALREIRAQAPDLLLLADVCLCEYTDHGHCGLVAGGEVLNDETLEHLSRAAVSLAAAGADIIAPSDMMDGRVAAIRRALDSSGFHQTPVLSYAAKYASAFYGPFREAAGSTPQFGDRRTYQMDAGNRREALREVKQDIAEGADMVMVKPALAYLDVVREVRDQVDVPVAAYNVSGEYSMVMAAARQGWVDGERLMMEILTGIRRAGADMIVTYHAPHAARLLRAGYE